MMTRTARCCCGKAKITVQGNPEFVVACNCMECQRRTGSVFSVNAYFKNESIVSESENTKTFIRESEAGKKLEFHFCDHCASTVWYEAEFMAGLTAIAVGCFADPNFPPPQESVWRSTKHPWVRFPLLSIPYKRQPPDTLSAILLRLKLVRLYYWKDYILSNFRKRKHDSSPGEEHCCLWRDNFTDLT